MVLLRYATLAFAGLVAFAATGSGAGGPAVLPVLMLPAVLLAAAIIARVSIVDTTGVVLAAARVSMSRRSRTVAVLRSCDPDAAGRPRPRAPGA